VATTGDHFPIALNKGGLDCLLTISMLGGDVKKFFGGPQLIVTKFMH
jgi:hypothetical protein